MLNKLNRLTTNFQFNITKKYGTKIGGELFSTTWLIARNYDGPPKIGFVVSNAIHKKATKRNRVKRLLREAVKINLSNIPNNIWLVFAVNNKILGKTYAEINDQVTRSIQKISIPH